MNLLQIKRLIVLVIILNISLSLAQSENNLKLTGGLIHTQWVESKKSITCGFNITTPQRGNANRHPVQVVLLVDAGPTMVGAAMQAAKKSAEKILGSLSDKDLYSIITYATYARIILPLQPLNVNNRRKAATVISRMKYDKGCNLSDGLKKTEEQLIRVKGQRTSGRLLIIVGNGKPNKGITDKKKLLSMVESLASNQNLFITTIGYDKDYDEDFYISMTKKHIGRAFFVEREQADVMESIIQEEIAKLTNVYASKLDLEIILPSGSTIKNVTGGLLKDNHIHIGSIPGNLVTSVFFDIVGRPSKNRDIEINIEYIEPVRQSTHKERVYFDLPVGSGKIEYDEHFGPNLLEYTTLRNLVDNIESLRKGGKPARQNLAASFKKTVKKIEQDNLILRSDYLTKVHTDLVQLQRDIENSAIDVELLIKRVKYKFIGLGY